MPCPTPPASQYWANWNASVCDPYILRRDTRIYWAPQSCGTVGQCVGTFYGENPGGGESINGQKFSGYSPIVDNNKQSGDKTLRLILQIWQATNQTPNGDDYIEILNLYYFRDASSRTALVPWRSLCGALLYNPNVSLSSDFILLGWGNSMNNQPEALAAIQNIQSHKNIIIPDSSGTIVPYSGSLLNLLISATPSCPAMPSWFINFGGIPYQVQYITNVAARI